jgi:hypothetical protein
MRPFDAHILEILNRGCDDSPIETISLGIHDFAVCPSGGPSIMTRFKAVFYLKGRSHVWEEGPTDIPVWLLAGQVPVRFDLPTPFALRMHLASGDHVEFHTTERNIEATIFDFGTREDGAHVMEIY